MADTVEFFLPEYSLEELENDGYLFGFINPDNCTEVNKNKLMNKILSGFYGEYCNSIWERVNNVLEITNASKRNNELASRLFTTFVLEGNPLQNKEKQKMYKIKFRIAKNNRALYDDIEKQLIRINSTGGNVSLSGLVRSITMYYLSQSARIKRDVLLKDKVDIIKEAIESKRSISAESVLNKDKWNVFIPFSISENRAHSVYEVRGCLETTGGFCDSEGNFHCTEEVQYVPIKMTLNYFALSDVLGKVTNYDEIKCCNETWGDNINTMIVMHKNYYEFNDPDKKYDYSKDYIENELYNSFVFKKIDGELIPEKYRERKDIDFFVVNTNNASVFSANVERIFKDDYFTVEPYAGWHPDTESNECINYGYIADTFKDDFDEFIKEVTKENDFDKAWKKYLDLLKKKNIIR